MRGGTTSRSGFYFQDLVLAERLLVHVLASRKAKIEGDPQVAAPEFRIEAPGTDGEGPDWDLVERHADVFVLEEVKRGRSRRRARETVSTEPIVGCSTS
jgi:hypothetical protein